MNQICNHLRRAIYLSLFTLGISGCATQQNKQVLPTEGLSMKAIYHQHMQQASMRNIDIVRQQSTTVLPVERVITQPTQTVTDCQFPTLVNPKITLHVFAHLASNDWVPIPAYQTSFTLYDKTHYALPGERGVC